MTAREDVFHGVAAPLPAAQSTASGWSLRLAEYAPEPSSPPPPPVRHRTGYAPFLDFVTTKDVDPRVLALDPLSLLRFVHANISTISSDSGLTQAATIFFGNTLAALREDAAWVVFGNGSEEVGAGRRSYIVGGIMERLARPLIGSIEGGQVFATDDDWLQGYAASVAEWIDERADDAEPPLPLPVPAASAAVKYRRPTLPDTTFFDSEGEPIAYGQRWGSDGPAEDSYSVTSNLERFAPLHMVAHTLIDYLASAYDVDVQQIETEDADLLQPRDDVREIVRVSPRTEDGAPLTLVFTELPGVVVEVGVLHSFPFPACGCDACDEDGPSQAGELENLVLVVARGGYAEQYPVRRRAEAEYALVSTEGSGRTTGSRGGKGEPPRLEQERLAAAAARLAALQQGWQPWPLRCDEAKSPR